MSKELEKAAALHKQANEILENTRKLVSDTKPDDLSSAEQDNLKQAQALYTEALMQDPTNYELYYNRSVVSDLLGFRSQSYHDFDAAIHYAPVEVKECLRHEKNARMMNEQL